MTPEQIAREAAKALWLATGGTWTWADGTEEEAVPLALPIIQAAIEKALTTVPVPGGLSEGQITAARDLLRVYDHEWAGYLLTSEQTARLRAAMHDLLAHGAHLTRALHDCGADGSAAVWSAGYEAGKAAGRAEGWREGAKAQHRADVQYANEEAATFDAGLASGDAAADVAYAVHEAPPVEPPGGGL